jgi:uncharacterized membrane protein YkvA (DUF1232 family)
VLGPSRARQYLTGRRDPRRLAVAASAARGRGGTWRGLGADLRDAWQLVRSYLRGDYRAVRLRSVLAVVVGAVYFLSPIDLIPDVFLLLGLTDDLVVVSLVFTVLREELAGFRAWQLERARQASTPLRLLPREPVVPDLNER